MENETTGKAIALTISTKIDLQAIFPTLKTDLIKICFLLTQINYRTNNSDGCSINVRKHDFMFGQKGFTSKVLKELVNHNIIKCSDFYVPNQTSMKYVMCPEYGFKPSKELMNKGIYNTHYYQKNELPVFLDRWVTDGYSVKGKDETKYVSKKKKLKVNDSSIVIELNEKIKKWS
ncbi:hypothetical protein [Pedobacter steynii]